MSSQDDPQSCTKCGSMPQDILMLACSHDLCLNCAADRLAFEMKKNKNTNMVVCQQCHQKTPLDAESLNVLKALIKPNAIQSKIYQQNAGLSSNKYSDSGNQTKYDRPSRNQPVQKGTQKYSYDKSNINGSGVGYDRGSVDRNNIQTKSKVSGIDVFQGISNKKTCTEHHQEQILYFCFDCKCECICPQCVIHGKHKDHDVKTIRKSQPLVKSEVDKYLQKFNHNSQTLLIKKSQIQKQIRGLNEQNNMSKRQIQQAFDDLRNKLNQQQKQMLSKCDQNLSDNLSELEKTSKKIVNKIDTLKSYGSTMSQASRKDQILFLNFYSRKHKQLQQQARQPEINAPQIQLLSNQPYISSILDISDQVAKMGSTPKGSRKV